MGIVHDRLKLLRVTLGLSMADMASLLDMGRASTWQYYETPAGFRGTRIPDKIISALLKAIESGKLDMSLTKLYELVPEAAHFQKKDQIGGWVNKVDSNQELQNIPILNINADAGPFVRGEEIASNMSLPKFMLWPLVSELAMGELCFLYLEGASEESEYVLIDRVIRKYAGDGKYVLLRDNRLHLRFCEQEFATGDLLIFGADHTQPTQRVPAGTRAPIVGRAIAEWRALVPRRAAIVMDRDEDFSPEITDDPVKPLFPPKAPGRGDPLINQARAQGIIGEQFDGYLGIAKPEAASEELRRRLAQNNAARLLVYQDISAKTGETVEVVASAMAEKSMARVSLGEVTKPSAQSSWTLKIR